VIVIHIPLRPPALSGLGARTREPPPVLARVNLRV
jgi:hypothetical protein